MATLLFRGRVIVGIGKFKDMTIPGRASLENAPSDWPETLCPGSLNVLVEDNGYPQDFVSRCNGTGVKNLDSQCFQPEFVIPRECIAKNKLKAKPDQPERGNAQVWRATLRTSRNGTESNCWLMRRFGSGLDKQLELVAAEKLRDKLALGNDDVVEVIVTGTWACS